MTSLLKKYEFHIIFIMMLMAFMALIALNTATSVFAQCVSTNDGTGVQCQILYAGQTINAGSVCVEIVDDNLVVNYETTGGWELVETHLWVGDDLTNMPQTKQGNPKIGNFPYYSGDITGNTSNSFQVSLAVLDFYCASEDKNYFVAAHAALRKSDGSGGYQTETAWADGDRFVERGMWGTFFTSTLTCECSSGGPTPTCETAFAYGGNYASCFLDLDLDNDGIDDFNRWGWTTGPLQAGTYAFDIYTGAGQCDLSKGTLVGTLTVVYDGSKADITYTMNSGFTMDETHLYVGNEILARDVNGDYTVAPGQYPFINDELKGVTQYTCIVNNLSGDIYIVAHAVVCSDN